MFEISDRLEQIDHDKLYSMIKFLGKMLFAGIIFRLVLWLGFDTFFIQRWLANSTARTLELLNVNFAVQGVTLVGEKASYIVNQDCTGWKSIAVFTALIFASSERIRDHLKFVLTGFVVIAVFNFARIVTTVYLSHQGIISFEIIHTLVWKWGLTLLVLLLWFYWLRNNPPTV